MHEWTLSTFRVGVIGAGRVGAVLAAALRTAGHEIVAVAGESNASRPGSRPCCRASSRQADRRRQGRRPAAADRSRRRPRQRRADARRVRRHPRRPVRRPHQRPARPRGARAGAAIGARRIAMHPAMTFTGTDVDLPRLADCAFGVTAGPAERAGRAAARRRPAAAASSGSTRSTARCTTPLLPTARTTWSPWSPRRWNCCATAGSDDPAATLRPLLTAALDNTLAYGDAALTGPIMRGDVETVRAHLADIAASRRRRCRPTSRWRARPPSTPSPTAGSSRAGRRRCSTTSCDEAPDSGPEA